MLRAVIAAVAALFVGLVPAVSAAAGTQDESGPTKGTSTALTWSVQPAGEGEDDDRPHWNFELEPGESVEDVARLNNFSDEPVSFRIYSHDAVNSPDGGFTLQPADVESTGVGAWVGLDEQVTVKPQDSVEVPFTLSVPDDALPGDHAGGIVASVRQEVTDDKGQRVVVDNRVGSRIYLRVAGDIAPALSVENLSVAFERSWIPFATGAVTVTYDVRNTGNVRLSGDQVVNGHGVFGWGAHTATPGPLSEILPGESVSVSTEVDGVLPLFRVTEEVVVTPVAPETTATVLPQVQAQEVADAWAVPWAELLILGLLLLWIAWSWWRRRRRAKKNKDDIAKAVAQARDELRQEMEQQAGQKETVGADAGAPSGGPTGGSSKSAPRDAPES